jgi:STE24 endopeptidase
MQFDAAAATAALVDGLGPEVLERAASYTAGNHWLLLWNLLVVGLVAWLIIRLGLLDRVAKRLRPGRPNLKVFLVAATYFLAATLLSLPWDAWADWWREAAYGRTSQPLGDWLVQGAIGTAVVMLLGSLFMVALYALMRRAGGRWWMWTGGLVAAAITILLIIAPVLIQPLFNDFQPLPEGEVRTVLEAHAIAAGVPTDRIFVYDGSRQSNNFTANVSGVFGSARIAISDVALKGADLAEVEAVTGHEIGHYVLGHVWRRVFLFAVLAVVAFFLIDRFYPWLASKFGTDATISDPRGLPVLMFMLSVVALLVMPLTNGISRLGEIEADRYSLETVNRPDALASSLVKTADYRDPRPHPVQEFLFYTHPAVERRVMIAMEWKATQAAR